jgi:hypothetical protein
VPIVFVTGYTDADTIDRIHQKVPGAPVISKPNYRSGLAGAVDEAIAQKTPCLKGEPVERHLP